MSDSAQPNDDGNTENSPQNMNGITTTVETTDDPVRIETDDGTIIKGRVHGDATVATATDDEIGSPTGGIATTLKPAEVDGQQVARILITSIIIGEEPHPQFAQIYEDNEDNDLRATKIVADVEVVDDE